MVLHKSIHILWYLSGLLLARLTINSYIVIYHLLHIYVVLIRVSIILRSVSVLVRQLSYLVAHTRLSLTKLSLLWLWHIVLRKLNGFFTGTHFFRARLDDRAGLRLNSVHLLQVISILPRYLFLTLGRLPLISTNIGAKPSHFLIFD